MVCFLISFSYWVMYNPRLVLLFVNSSCILLSNITWAVYSAVFRTRISFQTINNVGERWHLNWAMNECFEGVKHQSINRNQKENWRWLKDRKIMPSNRILATTLNNLLLMVNCYKLSCKERDISIFSRTHYLYFGSTKFILINAVC